MLIQLKSLYIGLRLRNLSFSTAQGTVIVLGAILCFFLKTESIWAQEFDTIQLKNGQTIQIVITPEGELEEKIFKDLTEEEQLKFLSRKKELLQDVANLLSSNRRIKIIGVASKSYSVVGAAVEPLRPVFKVVSNGTKFVFGKAIDVLRKNGFLDPSSKVEVSSAPLKAIDSKVTSADTIQEEGLRVLEGLVEMMDIQLWGSAKKIANSTSFAWSGYVGLSTGVALGKGFYGMIGVEIESSYNYETKKKSVRLYSIRQSLHKAALAIESSFVYGINAIFYDSAETTQNFRTLQLPFIFSSRFGEKMSGIGLNSGVSFILMSAVYLSTSGAPEVGLTLLGAYKVFTALSLYTTNTTKGVLKIWERKSELNNLTEAELIKNKNDLIESVRINFTNVLTEIPVSCHDLFR